MKAFGRSNRPFSPTDWIYGKKKPFLTKALRVQTSNVLTRIYVNAQRSRVPKINLLASRGGAGAYGGLGAFAGLGRGWRRFLRGRR